MNEAELDKISNLLDAGEYDEAIVILKKHLGTHPEDAEAWFQRGNAYGKKGDLDRVIKDFDEAIRLKSDPAVAYSNREMKYYNKGDLDRAISDFNEAIRLKQDFAKAYNNRGDAYGKKGDWDQAISDFNEAIRLKPDFAKAYNNRGDAYDEKGDWDQAISDFNEAIRLKPDCAESYNKRGVTHLGKRDWGQAIADFNEAIRLESGLAKSYNNRGIAYGEQGDWKMAIADYDKAIELKPGYAVVYSNRGDTYCDQGDWKMAILDLNKAIQLKPDYANAHYNRGNAYIKKGEYKNAIKDWEYAGRESPDLLLMTSCYLVHKTKDFKGDKIRVMILKFHDQVRELRNALFYGVQGDEKKKEEKISHYTNLRCLKRLAREKPDASFRFYNVAYMNDPEEGDKFFDLLQGIKALRDHLLLFPEEGMLKKILGYDAEPDAYIPIYIGSFVKREGIEDNLPMWRSYGKHEGKDCAGCSLGFNLSRFSSQPQEDSTKQFPTGWETKHRDERGAIIKHEERALCKVVYVSPGDKDVKIDFPLEDEKVKVEEGIKEIANTLREILINIREAAEKEQEKKKITLLKELVREILSEVRYLFKSAHYREEQEVRLVITRHYAEGLPLPPELRVDDDVLPPRYYLEADKDFMPDQVIFGPAAKRFSEWEFRLLHGQGPLKLKSENVRKSRIPFRS